MNGKSRIILAFCFSIAILILIGTYAYRSTDQYKSASDWVTHTEEVISSAQSILLDIQEIETAQRGYVITGESKYLEPYNNSIKTIESSNSKLRDFISDNPVQQVLFDSIEVRINSKIRFSKKVIEVQKDEGFKSAQELVSTDIGENLMKEIRGLTNDFISKERKLLNERLSIANDSFFFTRSVIISSIAFTIGIVLVTLFFFIRDYNKHILSEQKIIQSELRIKQFLESLPIGIYILGADGKPYYANSKSQEILGKGIVANASSDELPQIYKLYIAGTNNMYPADKLPVVRALRGEKNFCVEDLEIDKDGIRVPLRINATNITNSEGQTEYAIAAFEDVTDIREAEKKLKEARKMAEESAMLKETFLANMSHEIRTPMNAILGFTDLLLKRNLAELEKDYVQTIKASGENLLHIINDVLDVSKIESGLMNFETHQISIRELFSSFNMMFIQKAKEKNLSLAFFYNPNIPNVVLGDPTRLTQIIINLVGNAIKFTKIGGIKVIAKVTEENEDEQRIEFSVKDTGIGIPENKLSQIFERFTQAESNTTRYYGGTGLGLNIVKQLVELQGGTVQVKSTVGVGSEFTFNLPFKRATEIIPLRKEESVKNIQDLSSKRILVVEDNPVNVKYLLSLFDEYKITPELAENGKVAVEKVKNGKYDVVLMDIDMPEMNGYEATTIIRCDLKSNVPIIAMTAHAMVGEQEKCLQLGMNGFISKPIRENILLEKLFDIISAEPPINSKLHTSKQLLNIEFLFKAMRGRKDVIRDTIDITLRQLPEDMAVITEAVSKSDYDTIRRFSHRIKSTVSLMGMSDFETLLEEMEVLAGRKEDMTKINVLYESLNSMEKQAIKELQTERCKYL